MCLHCVSDVLALCIQCTFAGTIVDLKMETLVLVLFLSPCLNQVIQRVLTHQEVYAYSHSSLLPSIKASVSPGRKASHELVLSGIWSIGTLAINL